MKVSLLLAVALAAAAILPARNPIAPLGHVWHRRIATAAVKGAPDAAWTEIVCDVAETTGVHAVVFQFQGKGERGPLLDWWQFE